MHKHVKERTLSERFGNAQRKTSHISTLLAHLAQFGCLGSHELARHGACINEDSCQLQLRSWLPSFHFVPVLGRACAIPMLIDLAVRDLDTPAPMFTNEFKRLSEDDHVTAF